MSDAAVVQIISRLGVDFNQAVMSAEKLAASVNVANTSLLNLQKTATAMGAITIGQAGVAGGQTKIAKSTETATQATRKYTKSVQDLNKEYNVLGSMAERRISWFVTGSAVFGSLAALKEIAVTIKDVEMDMTTIARITEDVNFNFEEMRDSLQGLGVEYGMTWENVSDIAIRWSQAGYNVADTLELTKSALLALNTAELDAEYATQGLIAIMSQWQLKAEDLLPVIDKINKTADSYAITSQDIVDGLNRVGAAAKNAGMTIEETIGAITVLREASGRTGKEVGTALNTIFSYMTRDKTIKLMEALGIRVFEDEARTTFRSIIELMEELAARWQDASVSSQLMTSVETELLESFNEEMAAAVGLQEEWNDMQQRDISQAAAGVRRKNFFISLMSRFSKIQEVVNGQLDAEGYSMRENERTMATLEKQVQSLKAAAEQFAVAIGDAGLLEQMKGLVEGTASVITWFNDLDDSAKTLIITFAEVAIAIKLITALMNMMGLSSLGALGAKGAAKGAAKSSAEIMGAVGVSYAALNGETRKLTSSLKGLSGALKTVGSGLLAAFGGPWVLGITIAATAIYTLYKNVQTANATMIAHGELAENMIGDYDSLVNKLGQLEKGTDAYNKTAEELRATKGKIANALPEVIDGWDKETDSVKINREEMDKLITTSKDLRESQEDLTESLESSIRLMQEEVAEHAKKAQEWENEKNVLQDLVERRDKLTEALSRQKEGSEEAKKTEEALGETERLIADIAEEAGLKRNATVDDVIAKLNELKIAENQAVINTQTTELNKVKAVKEASLARLAIIQQEIAAYNDPMSWGFTQAAGNFLKDINPLNRYNKDPKHLNLDNLKKERAESVKAAQEAKTQIDSIEKAIKESQRNIAAINADITTGGGSPADSGAAAKGAGKEIDYLAEAIQRLTDAAKQYDLVNMDLESVLEAVNRRLGISNAEYDYLNGKVEAGTATAQDYARMQELLARKTALLKNEQVQLANANRAYQVQIDSLTPILAKATEEYDRFKAAGDEKHTKDAASAVSALKSEIDSLSGSIASNTQQLWENQGALDQLATSAYTAYYQQTMAWMSHMDAIGKMNSELQSQVLGGFNKQKMLLQDLQDLEKRQFNDRLDRLKAERDRIKDAYDARMKQYEDEIEANDRLIEQKEKQAEVAVDGIEEQIKAIQRLMDLLDDDAESEDREEAERQHNKKLAELAEERIYHELRTGLEHQERIAEIDDETAEEKRRWQLQQNDWARKDQKDAYQDQINALKEKQKAIEKSSREEVNQLKKQNDRKKQEMQKFYNELESILNDSNLRMMAASQEKGEEFIRRMGEVARQATQAFNDNYRPDSVVGGARDLVDDARSGYTPGSGDSSKRPSESDYTGGSGGKKLIATIDPDFYTDENGIPYVSASNIAGLLGLTATWDDAADEVVMGEKSFKPWKMINGRAWLNVFDVAEKLGFKPEWNYKKINIYDKAHTGAKVKTTGIAELMHDERVLSPGLTVSFEKLAAVLSRPTAQAQIGSMGSSADLEKIADRVIAAIERKGAVQVNGPAVNIEHAGFENKYDGQSLGIDIRNVLTATGGR